MAGLNVREIPWRERKQEGAGTGQAYSLTNLRALKGSPPLLPDLTHSEAPARNPLITMRSPLTRPHLLKIPPPFIAITLVARLPAHVHFWGTNHIQTITACYLFFPWREFFKILIGDINTAFLGQTLSTFNPLEPTILNFQPIASKQMISIKNISYLISDAFCQLSLRTV